MNDIFHYPAAVMFDETSPGKFSPPVVLITEERGDYR